MSVDAHKTTHFGVEHRLHARVRIRFKSEPSPEMLRSVIWLIERDESGVMARPALAGRGLVLWCVDKEQSIEIGLQLLKNVLQAPCAHLVIPPERGLAGVLQRSRTGGIKVLMALAVAGWALPVLPGTPFFLMAWWLGWRPEPSPSSQRKSISMQTPLTLADKGVNP